MTLTSVMILAMCFMYLRRGSAGAPLDQRADQEEAGRRASGGQ